MEMAVRLKARNGFRQTLLFGKLVVIVGVVGVFLKHSSMSETRSRGY